MTTLRARIQAALAGTALSLAFTQAGAATIDLTGGYNICTATTAAAGTIRQINMAPICSASL